MHSETQFKQHKIEILSKFISPDSEQFRPKKPKSRMFNHIQNSATVSPNEKIKSVW